MKNPYVSTGKIKVFMLLFSRMGIREFWGKMKKPSILEEGFGKTIDFGRRIWKKSNCSQLRKIMKNPYVSTGKIKVFMLLFSLIPIREFWGKMKKPSILEEGFGKTIDFGRRIWKRRISSREKKKSLK